MNFREEWSKVHTFVSVAILINIIFIICHEVFK